MKILAFFKLIRINNWIKNLLIFLPIFFAGEILNIDQSNFISLALTFFCFCLASSSIYILNDIIDIEKDKVHPKKCKRPLASNIFNKQQALLMLTLILIVNCFLLSKLKLAVTTFIIAYFLLNILYCFITKKIPIIDITSISIGFVFRVYCGGVSANVDITHWIVIMIFLLMFSVALAKRRDDLVLNEKTKTIYRTAQKGYNLQFIDMASIISFTVTLMTYILYSVSQDVILRMQSQHVYITALPVFLGILRYLQLSIVEKKTGSPVKLVLSDTFLISTIIIWLTIFSIIIYV